MGIFETIEKVKTAHSKLSAALCDKGVDVPSDVKLTQMPQLVESIKPANYYDCDNDAIVMPGLPDITKVLHNDVAPDGFVKAAILLYAAGDWAFALRSNNSKYCYKLSDGQVIQHLSGTYEFDESKDIEASSDAVKTQFGTLKFRYIIAYVNDLSNVSGISRDTFSGRYSPADAASNLIWIHGMPGLKTGGWSGPMPLLTYWTTTRNGEFTFSQSFYAITNVDALACLPLKAKVAQSNTNNDHCIDGLTQIRNMPVFEDLSTKTQCQYMMNECRSVLNLGQTLDLTNATSVVGMFSQCRSLKEITITAGCAEKVASMEAMFMQCRSLRTLNLPKNFGIGVTASGNAVRMFTLTGMLENINGDLCLGTSFALPSARLTHQSLMNVINSIQTVTEATTLTLSQTCLDMLTDDEKKIATYKGWTLTTT